MLPTIYLCVNKVGKRKGVGGGGCLQSKMWWTGSMLQPSSIQGRNALFVSSVKTVKYLHNFLENLPNMLHQIASKHLQIFSFFTMGRGYLSSLTPRTAIRNNVHPQSLTALCMCKHTKISLLKKELSRNSSITTNCDENYKSLPISYKYPKSTVLTYHTLSIPLHL